MTADFDPPRPLVARVDAAALRANWRAIRARATAERLFAVVKADGYGHGLRNVAGALARVADGFALIEWEGALALRRRFARRPILLLHGAPPGRLNEAIENRFDLVVHHGGQIADLARAGADANLTAFLKIDIGMNRLGFAPSQALAALRALRRAPAVSNIVLTAHFARADSPRGVARPLAIFESFRARYAPDLPSSLGNSALALLHRPRERWARIGIALYGGSPAPRWESSAALGLRAAMTLATRLISIRKIEKSDAVGYGGAFVARRATTIGIAAAGYGDGYPFAAQKGAPALVGGRLARAAGRVSMDLLALDLGLNSRARIGDEVVLWGDNPSADEVAAACGTISYRLFAGLGARVPRRFADTIGKTQTEKK